MRDMDAARTRSAADRRELAVLLIVPAVVLALTVVSWVLAHWQIGPLFLNAGLALVSTVFGGFQRFVVGFKDIGLRKITVNVFVVVALLATLAIGEFRPAAIIVFIMAVAGALESYTLDKTRRSIRDLLDFTPKTATLRRNGEEVTVAVTETQVGDRGVVRPGERIPVDGTVVAGASSVNQAPVTGESMPVEKAAGSAVFSGTLNESGRLEITTGKVGESTTLARIVHLVQEAQGTRAPSQNLADRFTTWFLPTVVVLAVVAFLVTGEVKAAVSVLLVACPCAFAIETADVTLMNDDIAGVADFMWMSAKVLRRIKLNIFFSMIYNVIGLALSVVGLMTPIVAILFQEAGCITVVISSTLLLWTKGRAVSSACWVPVRPA
jgi:Cd2+/Zn2+-exporting ATPase